MGMKHNRVVRMLIDGVRELPKGHYRRVEVAQQLWRLRRIY